MGWGGAFSDGKLNLTTDFGGNLSDYIDSEELLKLINYVDKIYCRFGAEDNIYGNDRDTIDRIKKEASKAMLKFIPAHIRHLGTEQCFIILKIYMIFSDKVEIRTGTEVSRIVSEEECQGYYYFRRRISKPEILFFHLAG